MGAFDELMGQQEVAQAAPVVAPQEEQGGAFSDLTSATPIAPPQGSAQPTVATPVSQEPIDPNSVKAGLGRGISSFKSNVGGTLEAIGEATGSEGLREYGQEVRQENNTDAAAFGAAPDSFLDDPLNYLKSMGLQVAPALGANIAGGAAGSIAGSPFGAPGRIVGGIAGTAFPSFFQNAGAIQNEIKNADPNASSPLTALGGSVPLVALDVFGARGLVKPAAIVQGMSKGEIVREAAKQAAKGTALEAGTGAAAGAATPLIGALGAGVAPDWDRVIEGAESGLIGGTVASLPFSVAKAAREVRDVAQATPMSAPSSRGQDNQAKGSLGTLQSALGGAATSVLDPLANIAPSMKEFLGKFKPDMSGREASGTTTKEKTDFMSAGWMNDFDQARADFKGSKKDFYSALADPRLAAAMTPENQAAVAQARQTLDNIQGTATQVGMDAGYVKDYLPVGPDWKSLKKDRSAFLNDLVSDQRSPFFQKPQEAEAAINKYIAQGEYPRDVPPILQAVVPDPANPGSFTIDPAKTVGGQPDTYRNQYGQMDTLPRFGNLEANRFFGDVPQDILLKHSGEFKGLRSGKKLDEAIDSYIEGASHRIAVADDFGVNGEKANGLLLKAAAEAKAAGRPMTNAELNHAYRLLNAYNGTYGRIEQKPLKIATNVISTLNTVTTLPLSTIASIPELILPAVRGDISAAVASFGPTVHQAMKNLAVNTLFKGVPRDQFSKVAADAGLTLKSANSVASARLGDSVLLSGTAKVNRAFFKLNMNTYFSHFNRIYAAKTADHIMQRNLHALSSGVDITSAKGQHLANQLRSMGLPIMSNADAIAMWDPKTKSMSDSARAYRVLGMRRFTDQTVLEPNLSNTPLWMANGNLHLLAQLKRYPAAFTNVILPQIARKVSPGYSGSYSRAIEGGVAAVATVSFMVALGYLQDYLKQVAKQGTTEPEDDRTEVQVMKDVLSNTVMPIQVGLPLQALESKRYGSDPLSAVAGPTAGKAGEVVNLYKSISSYMDGGSTPYIARFLNKTINPLGSFKYMKDTAKEIDEEMW